MRIDHQQEANEKDKATEITAEEVVVLMKIES